MDGSDPPHVLSVEDNAETKLLLQHQLEGSYALSFASTVDEALDILDEETFDLLLLDINLGPGKNGADLLHMARDRHDSVTLPAVALTAYAMPGDREDLLDEGFDAYVSKPFTQTELNEAIDRALTAA